MHATICYIPSLTFETEIFDLVDASQISQFEVLVKKLAVLQYINTCTYHDPRSNLFTVGGRWSGCMNIESGGSSRLTSLGR
jgi:hypothetical protein